MDVVDPLRLRFARGCAAHAFIKRNADAGRLTLKGTEDKFIIHHAIETRPIQIRQELPQQGGDIRHVGDAIRFTTR